jgi:hypothetical protein
MERGHMEELSLKEGDVIECLDDYSALGSLTVGKKYTVGIDGLFEDDEGDRFAWSSATFKVVSRAVQGPVRTVTRKEIVPGVYGKVQVFGSLNVSTELMQGAAELRAAISTLTQIADALEDNQ